MSKIPETTGKRLSQVSDDTSNTEWHNTSLYSCINLLTFFLAHSIESINNMISIASYSYLLNYSNLGILFIILMFTTFYENKNKSTLQYQRILNTNYPLLPEVVVFPAGLLLFSYIMICHWYYSLLIHRSCTEFHSFAYCTPCAKVDKIPPDKGDTL